MLLADTFLGKVLHLKEIQVSTGLRTIIFVTFSTAFVLGWKWQKQSIFFFHALKVTDLIFWNFAYEYKSFTPWRARRGFS